jgi:phosphatidylglycerol---prolipoprotein diacylglyceryl transferase
MHPILVQIGPITIYSYGFMLAVAVVTCAFLLSHDAAKQGLKRESVFDLVFWTVLWGIVGARIFYVIIAWEFFAPTPWEILLLNKGGLAWQGGLIAGTLAGIWFTRSHKLSLRKLMDLCAPYVALGQAIGRIGCFLNGCCFGKPWAYGIFFPVHDARLYPTQLYETAGLFLIFIILKYAQKKPHTPGMLFAFYLWLAAIERFIVEFFRADHTILWGGLSLPQYVSMLIFAAGIAVYLKFKK